MDFSPWILPPTGRVRFHLCASWESCDRWCKIIRGFSNYPKGALNFICGNEAPPLGRSGFISWRLKSCPHFQYIQPKFDRTALKLWPQPSVTYEIHSRSDTPQQSYFIQSLECSAFPSSFCGFYTRLQRFCFIADFFTLLILLKGTQKVLPAADLLLISSHLASKHWTIVCHSSELQEFFELETQFVLFDSPDFKEVAAIFIS